MGKIARLALGAPLLVAAVLAMGSPAQAATRCEKGSTSYSGRCWTIHHVYKHLRVAEAVPLVNHSSHAATFHCSFTRTISRTFEAGISLSYEAKVGLFDLVDVGTHFEVHLSVSQTAAQATEAGLSVRLRAHQRATCERTYGYVTTKVKDVEYAGMYRKTHHYSVKVPSYLGVRLVN